MSDSHLPTFIIGGAPRSGTTYLAQALSRHPQVAMAQPFIPEPKTFFGPRRSRAEYLEHYRQMFDQAAPGQACGEKTSNYLENAEARGRIFDTLPDVKLLFIVREPVARAYSNFLWSTKNGLETLPFEAAIAAEGQRASPLPPEKSHARPFDYLCRGEYARLARPYLELFGPDRVRFVLYENITQRPEMFWSEVQEYLALEQLPSDQFDIGVINAVSYAEELQTETESRLRESLQPQVAEFQELTGLDLSPWRYAA